MFFVTPLRSNLDMLPPAAAPPADADCDGGALIGYDDWGIPSEVDGWVNPYGWRIPSEDDDNDVNDVNDDGRNHVNDDGTAPG